MKITLDVRSAAVGLILGCIAMFAIGQKMFQPRDVAGRYQIVAADGRLWVFDTSNIAFYNVRVDPRANDSLVLVAVPSTVDATCTLPMVAPVLPDSAKGISKPADKRSMPGFGQ